MPRHKQVDTMNDAATIERSVTLPADGSIKESIESLNDFEVVDRPMPKKEIDKLAFMEEKLTVMIHEDANPNAENPVQIAVNGVNQFFIRGVPQEVKRKYVEVLARAKKTNISTPEVTDSSGARTNIIRSASSLRYPFQVVHDPNPIGPSWLKGIMSEGF